MATHGGHGTLCGGGRGLGAVAQEWRGGSALGFDGCGGCHEDAVECEGCCVGAVGGDELGAAGGCALEALEQRGDVGRLDEVEECGQGDEVVEGELGEGSVGGEVVDDEGRLGVGVEGGCGVWMVFGLDSCLVHGCNVWGCWCGTRGSGGRAWGLRTGVVGVRESTDLQRRSVARGVSRLTAGGGRRGRGKGV